MKTDHAYKYIVFMKIGYHGDETLDEIIDRKMREERSCGVIFWGYGGTICHPLNQVSPFVRSAKEQGYKVKLIFSVTPSKFHKERHNARYYSADRKIWQSMPNGSLITSSAFAITCRNFRKVNYKVDISKYKVAIGPNKGKNLHEYLSYRTDKACAVYNPQTGKACHLIPVTFEADVVFPYSVFCSSINPNG